MTLFNGITHEMHLLSSFHIIEAYKSHINATHKGWCMLFGTVKGTFSTKFASAFISITLIFTISY